MSDVKGVKKKTVRAVLFDCDGVVADSMSDHAKAWVRAFRDSGVEVKKEWVFEYEGAPFCELARAFYERCGIEPKEKDIEMVAMRKERYFDELHEPRIYAGIFPILDLLQNRGISAGLVTGASRMALGRTLPAEVVGRFQIIVTGDDVTQGKPHPEPYLLGAKLLDLEPADCLVVENGLFGIRAAKAAHMRCVALTTTLPTSSLDLADVIVKDHEELIKKLDNLIKVG